MFETASRDTKITKTEFSNRLRDMGIKKIRRGKLQVLWYVGIKRIEEDED